MRNLNPEFSIVKFIEHFLTNCLYQNMSCPLDDVTDADCDKCNMGEMDDGIIVMDWFIEKGVLSPGHKLEYMLEISKTK